MKELFNILIDIIEAVICIVWTLTVGWIFNLILR